LSSAASLPQLRQQQYRVRRGAFYKNVPFSDLSAEEKAVVLDSRALFAVDADVDAKSGRAIASELRFDQKGES
jgi:hypothetical protein